MEWRVDIRKVGEIQWKQETQGLERMEKNKGKPLFKKRTKKKKNSLSNQVPHGLSYNFTIHVKCLIHKTPNMLIH